MVDCGEEIKGARGRTGRRGENFAIKLSGMMRWLRRKIYLWREGGFVHRKYHSAGRTCIACMATNTEAFSFKNQRLLCSEKCCFLLQ